MERDEEFKRAAQMMAVEISAHMAAIQEIVRRYAKPGMLTEIAVIIGDKETFGANLVWHSGKTDADLLRLLEQAKDAMEYSR